MGTEPILGSSLNRRTFLQRSALFAGAGAAIGAHARIGPVFVVVHLKTAVLGLPERRARARDFVILVNRAMQGILVFVRGAHLTWGGHAEVALPACPGHVSHVDKWRCRGPEREPSRAAYDPVGHSPIEAVSEAQPLPAMGRVGGVSAVGRLNDRMTSVE